MHVDPASLELLKALCLGFAFAGLLASGYELLANRPISFRVLEAGGIRALATVPILIFSAPAIIIRNTIRGRRIDRRPVAAVVLAAMVAGFWSMLCGRVILDGALLILAA